MPYDVRVFTTDRGGVAWNTDMVGKTQRQAAERARFLIPRVTAVEVRNQATWDRVSV